MILEDANDFLCAVGEDWRFRLSMAKGTVSSIGYHMLLPRFILRILGMFKLKFELSANAESCEDVFFKILYIQLMKLPLTSIVTIH